MAAKRERRRYTQDKIPSQKEKEKKEWWLKRIEKKKRIRKISEKRQKEKERILMEKNKGQERQIKKRIKVDQW